MKFGPINLWNKPHQSLFDKIVCRKFLNKTEDLLYNTYRKERELVLKELEHLYYLRTGKIFE